MEQEKVEPTEVEKHNVLLMLHGEILSQLLQYSKFQAFLAANYEIKQNIDDTSKGIGFTVREMTNQESADILKKALEQAQSSLVTATPEDLRELEKTFKNKK